MSDVTLRQLEYFVAVVDHGSITAAAAACHASQAAASMAIVQLEKALGADLLVRSRARGIVPTPEGLEFAAHARAVLDRLAEASAGVAENLGQIRGPLRVGCTPMLSPRLVPPLVEHLTKNYSSVDLRIVEGAPAGIQDQIRLGRLDLGLLYQLQADPDLDAVHLSGVATHVVLPADHRLADQPSVRLADLVAEPAILLDVPPTIDRVTEIVRDVGLELNVWWTSPNMETIRCMVARGLGYSFTNSPPATGSTFDGLTVVYRPIAEEHTRNAIVAVLPAGQVRPRRVAAALDALQK